MNIEIKVSEPISEMSHSESQVIKRVANVLIEHGFNVTIQWGDIATESMPTIRKHPLRTTITHY
jgi:hypothetical protein